MMHQVFIRKLLVKRHQLSFTQIGDANNWEAHTITIWLYRIERSLADKCLYKQRQVKFLPAVPLVYLFAEDQPL